MAAQHEPTCVRRMLLRANLVTDVYYSRVAGAGLLRIGEREHLGEIVCPTIVGCRSDSSFLHRGG